MKLRTQLSLGYLLVFGLITGIAAISYNGFISHTESNKWVAHTHEVISEAHRIEKLLIDMETGQRGFLLTSEEEFLEPYRLGREEYETAIKDLKFLVDDNPAQVRLLEKVERLVVKWDKVAATPEMKERRKVATDAVDAEHPQRVLSQGVGKGILDEMRSTMDIMRTDFQQSGNIKGEALTEAVAKAMVDSETGQRGYLITGEDEFLEPFRMGKQQLDQSVNRLRLLVENAHDRVGIANDLDRLQVLASQWRNEAGQSEIELRREVDAGNKTQQDIENTLGGGKGKATLDKMRVIMNRMDSMFVRSENDKARSLLISVAKAMVDQETGQRGFIITGKEEFLEPFIAGQSDFETTIAELRKLNANAFDVPVMTRDIRRLERLAADWHSKAASPELALRDKMN